MTDDGEIPLTGGRNTAGVVRVGDTVRKPVRPNTPFLHELLRYLEDRGFAGSPRVLGVDNKNREILTFIEGTPASEQTSFTDGQLVELAKLIRRFHDMTAGSPLCGNEEVVAHCDLAISNVIFRHGMPYAFIDFDCARPASRAFDLGYAAWKFLRLGDDGYESAEQARRLHLFVAAYGGMDMDEVMRNILLRQDRHIQQGRENDKTEMEEMARRNKAWCLKYRKILIPEKNL